MIRELRWDDMRALIDNYYAYYDEMKNSNPDLGLIFYNEKPGFESEVNWFTNTYRDLLKGDVVAMVAEEDDKVVGMCDVHRLRPGSEISHTGNLGIAILDGYRNRGIGKELMSRTIEECRGKFETLILAAFAINERAISLYRKLGFVEHGRLPRAVKRDGKYYDEVHMLLQL